VKWMGENKRRCLFPVVVMGLSFAVFPALVLGDWSDWWRTPEQRALKLYETGNHDALIEHSPNENWTALGQFQGKEFSAASTSFAKRREALKAADKGNAATTALYNQGVSDVLSGQYEQAIEHFDEVLSEDSGFADAQYNRDIARKLQDLQENPENSQDQEGEQGEQGEQGEEGEEGEEGEQNSEPSDSENSENESSDSSNEEASDGENASESDSESEQDNSSSTDEDMEGGTPDSASEEQQQQEEQQARDALAAEALQEQLEKGEDAGKMMEQSIESEQPLSESEQATEQILRRIPDDPRGLLRRKLEQSHRNEFPEVRDALEPW
jgi:Ca-activated chloride channel family protein